MTRLSTRRLAAALIIGLHLSGVFTDILHQDVVPFASPAGPETISTHNCGPREIHKTLEGGHFCVPCFRLATGAACETIGTAVCPPVPKYFSLHASSGVFRTTSLLPFYHRGPPSVSPYA